MAKSKNDTRKILIVLSDRGNRLKKPIHVEVISKPDGTIVKETVIKRLPVKPCYDEVWQNDEGRRTLDRCNTMSRIYSHPLQKPRK